MPAIDHPRAVVAAVAAAALGALARHRWRNWGATMDERAATLPGDELIPEPATTVTRAVGIDAPAAEVWRWLVQIGRDRGGMYSYDWLENLIGLDIHSTDEIHDEWQHLEPGDRVTVVPAGWGPLPTGYSFPVAAVDPGHSLVLRQAPPEHPWNAVWTFVITSDGPARCRLVSRGRSERRGGVTGLLNAVATEAMDPITLLMTRAMLLGIKRRAERGMARCDGVTPHGAVDRRAS